MADVDPGLRREDETGEAMVKIDEFKVLVREHVPTR